jgi:hypothetical protein
MFYLLAETGIHSHEGIKVNGIGLDKALEIAIDANRFRYWPAQATFVDARNGMEMAASRHGPGVVTQVQNAWAAVGVGSPATFKISGYMRRAGTAVSGVSVALSGGQSRSVSTSSTGYYEFSGMVANHDYVVTPSTASFDLTPGSRRFDVLSRNEVADFTVTYTVSGQVFKYGQGFPGVSVSLAGGSGASATTNAAGSYAFPGLQPGLSYVVTPSLAGASISPSSFSTGPLTGNVIQNFTVLGPGVGTDGPVLVFRNGFSAMETNTFPSRDLRSTAGVFRSDPAIAISTGGNAYIVARDSKEPTLGSVYINTLKPDGTLGGWRFLGATIQGSPAITTIGETAHIAARDRWGGYWATTFHPDTGGKPWTFLGGNLASDPALASCSDGSVYIAGREPWGAVWVRRWDASPSAWRPWSPVGGITKGKPSVVCGSDNAVYIAVRDPSDSMWLARVFQESSRTWNPGGGVLNGDLSAVAIGGDIHVVGLSYSVPHERIWHVGSGWSDWQAVGGVLAQMSATSYNGNLYLAGQTTTGDLFWWSGASRSWTNLSKRNLAAGSAVAAGQR